MTAEKTIQERPQSLAEKLKARAQNLQKRSKEELDVILVDVSGSMNEPCGSMRKLDAVKQSIPMLNAVGNYLDYGLVAFGTDSYCIQTLTSSFAHIQVQSEQLMTIGQTNIPAALRMGRRLIQDADATPDVKKRMILMTDGQNNMEHYSLDKEITACTEGGIVVDTIGFGPDADMDLLKEIAKRTGGKCTQALSPLALENAYRKLNYRVRYIEHKEEVTK